MSQLTREHDGNGQHDERAREQPDLERGPWTLLFPQRRDPQPLHGPLSISALQILRDHRLGLVDEAIDVLVGVEV